MLHRNDNWFHQRGVSYSAQALVDHIIETTPFKLNRVKVGRLAYHHDEPEIAVKYIFSGWAPELWERWGIRPRTTERGLHLPK